MRTAAETKPYWTELSAFTSLADLKEAVLKTEEAPAVTKSLRSVCWKAFLLFQNLDRTAWPTPLVDSRSAYDSLRSHYLHSIEHPDEVESEVDPLSEHNESPWIALREDEALRTEIFQDVERCMPESIYFRQPDTQKMLLDILFIYCKLNPDVGYRQGMHELAAPVLWVLERDALEPTTSDIEEDAMLSLLLDGKYIEHDTFTIFALVMQGGKSFFEPGTDDGLPTNSAPGTPSQSMSPILARCAAIFHSILPMVDPELANHLNELDLVPQIFLMRWIRLLFGREFPFDDVIRMWDALFALDPSLELVNHICVAMFIRVRWQLVDADVNDALSLLLRYPSPSPHAPMTFVEDALAIRSNPCFETGKALILKYTNRAPEQPKPAARSMPRGINVPSLRNALPFGAPPLPFESLISDAARGVLSRSEKWWFNQAVRDTIGEVKKNVQSLQSGRNSPLPRLGQDADGRPYRRVGRPDVSSTIAANVLRKLTALEERNRQLSKMLESAVGDLWDFQKTASDREDSTVPRESLEALSVAIAKAQFVQVYLSDSGLPLTEDAATGAVASGEQNEQTKTVESTAAADPEQPASDDAQDAVHVTQSTQPGSPSSSPPTQPVVPSTPVRESNELSRTLPSIALTHAERVAGSPSRRPIAQSSYSWMLGQAHDGHFTTASPFPPNEKRQPVPRDKAFLFGQDPEDDPDFGVGTSELPPAKAKLKKKGRSEQSYIGLGDMAGAEE